MNVLENREDGTAVIELSRREIGILRLVGTEFTQGAYSPDNDSWSDVVPVPREEVLILFEQLPKQSA